MVVHEIEPGLALIESPTRPATLRVALVDPDPIDRTMFAHILRQRGHDVELFDCTAEVCRDFADNPFDVVVVSGVPDCLASAESPACHAARPAMVVITNEVIDDSLLASFDVVLPRLVGSRELLAAVDIAARGSTRPHRFG